MVPIRLCVKMSLPPIAGQTQNDANQNPDRSEYCQPVIWLQTPWWYVSALRCLVRGITHQFSTSIVSPSDMPITLPSNQTGRALRVICGREVSLRWQVS